TMTMTNDAGVRTTGIYRMGVATNNVSALGWVGLGLSPLQINPSSLMIPLRTNVPFLTESAYSYNKRQLVDLRLNPAFERTDGFPMPRWGLNATNRVQFVMVDNATKRIIDYVQLNGINSVRDLTEESADPDLALKYEGLWSTNRVGGTDI